MALLPSDPKKQKQVLIGLLPILLAFAYYQFYHGPRALEAEELETRVETLTSANMAAQAILTQYGPDLPRRLAVFEEHIRQLEQLIPRRSEVPLLIDQITEQALHMDVELTAFNPAAEQPGEFYSQQNFGVVALGDYHSIGAYITAIGSLPRIVRPHQIRLSVAQVAGGPGDVPLLRAEFTLQTYIMPAAGAAADQ